MELNVDTLRPKAGPNSQPSLTIYDYRVVFGLAAIKKLSIKQGDRISFKLEDGQLKMQFDPQRGFPLSRKSNSSFCIYSKELCDNLKKIAGEKIYVGEFRGGSYLLEKY